VDHRSCLRALLVALTDVLLGYLASTTIHDNQDTRALLLRHWNADRNVDLSGSRRMDSL
jgi:hypothetical protein